MLYYCIEQFFQGDGYGSYVSSVEIDYTMNGKTLTTTIVVKINAITANENNMEELINKVFKKELQFINDFVPDLNNMLKKAGLDPLAIPACYHGVIEPEKEHIYMEDLRWDIMWHKGISESEHLGRYLGQKFRSQKQLDEVLFLEVHKNLTLIVRLIMIENNIGKIFPLTYTLQKENFFNIKIRK